MGKTSGGGQNAHHAILRAALTAALVGLQRLDLLQCSENALLEEPRGGIGIAVSSTHGLRDDRVDDAELQAVCSVRLERCGGLSRLARVALEDRCAALR